MITDKSLKLFHRVASEIPAYRNFLKENNIEPNEIDNLEKFRLVPTISKKGYLQKNNRHDLIWPQYLKSPLWYSATSGSTGEPYYFPRTDEIAERGSRFAEEFIENSSYGDGSTLVIIGFGMGIWIGGIITLRSFEIASTRINKPISFLPTGYNKNEIFKALKKLAPDFQQTILIGYPPFIKEVVDEAADKGIKFEELNIRLIFAAESFSESFRDYLCAKIGIENPILDTLNIYGTADLGAIAYETPLSILVRRIAIKKPELFEELFGQIQKTPTLAQYHSDLLEIEESDGELLITSDGAIPLVRYAIGDNGGVFDYSFIESKFAKYGIDIEKEAKNNGLYNFKKSMPFVYVYERTDLSTSLHGILIYPEYIKAGIDNLKISEYLSGKFNMQTRYDENENQYLEVNLELKKAKESSEELENNAYASILENLKLKSSEFSEITKTQIPEKLVKIKILPNGEEQYFAQGVKQKWVNK
jgi:phenylacetate-CoA ligase